MFWGQRKIPPIPPLLKGGTFFCGFWGVATLQAVFSSDGAACVGMLRAKMPLLWSSGSDTSGGVRHKKREALQAKSLALLGGRGGQTPRLSEGYRGCAACGAPRHCTFGGDVSGGFSPCCLVCCLRRRSLIAVFQQQGLHLFPAF